MGRPIKSHRYDGTGYAGKGYYCICDWLTNKSIQRKVYRSKYDLKRHIKKMNKGGQYE